MREGPAWALAAFSAAFLLLSWKAILIPFLSMDCFNLILANPVLRRRDGLSALLSPLYFESYGESGYRPLTTVVYFLTMRFSGGWLPAFKLAKFAVLLGSAAAVRALGGRLLGDGRWALTAAALYLVETSAPVFFGAAFQPDLLAAFWSLTALLCHRRNAEAGWDSRGWTLATVLCYLAALSSKESSLFLPLLLFLWETVLSSATWEGLGAKTWVRAGAPLWAVAGVYLAWVRWGVEGESFYGPHLWSFSAFDSVSASVLADYWRIGPLAGTLGACALGLGLASAAARPSGRAALLRRLLFGSGWAMLALWPALNLLPHFTRYAGNFHHADRRYLAFAGVGMIYMIAWCGLAAERVWPASGRWLRVLAVGAVLVRAWQAAADAQWSGRPDAAESIVAPLGSRSGGEALISLPLLRQYDLRLARSVEDSVVRRLPPEGAVQLLDFFRDPAIYAGGWESIQARRIAESADADEAMSIVRAETIYRSGLRLGAEGRGREARRAFEKALGTDPDQAAACRELARLGRLGDCPVPLPLHTRLDWARAEYERGESLARSGSYADAYLAFTEAERRSPAYVKLGEQAAWQEDLLRTGARAAYEKGLTAYLEGSPARASFLLTAALRALPAYPEARLSRAAVLSFQGRWSLAEADCTAALDSAALDRNLKAALLTSRATALWRQGRWKAAEADLQKAVSEAPRDWVGMKEAEAFLARLRGRRPRLTIRRA